MIWLNLYKYELWYFSIIMKVVVFFVLSKNKMFSTNRKSHFICSAVRHRSNFKALDLFWNKSKLDNISLSLSLSVGFSAMLLRDHPCFSLIRLHESHKSTLEVTCGQVIRFDFFCSVVGCVNVVKDAIVYSRVRNAGRCKRCGGQQTALCPDKPKNVIPTDVHNQLATLLSDDNNEDFVIGKNTTPWIV